MRHVSDGVLRRLDDEPLAVPDRVIAHLADCASCSARQAEIARDTRRAAEQFSDGRLASDTDIAWARLRRELARRPDGTADRRVVPTPARWRRLRFPTVSLRGALALGAVGIVVASTAAAATLTTIFAPTHVAPVSVSPGDARAIAAFIGLGPDHSLGGFATPQGSTSVRFGTIRWSSPQTAHPVSSLAQASAEAGFPVALPAHLPAGIGTVQQVTVQPRVSATVTFNSSAGKLDGSSVTLDAGPGVLVEYGATNANGQPTLGVATMPRPTARSSGASLNQIEAFLLSQPGLPPQLAEEIRLLGDLRTVLPVPVPPGASVRSVQIGGWPGVLLADSSNAAAGVAWEDGRGMLRVVGGILDSRDVLNVAAQLG
ncbi:MAG: hypothetical protein JO027_21660 [Solirubrobacterales bacterium]|nr:hypothetical protein [Solirubrobacterales bacterium]